MVADPPPEIRKPCDYPREKEHHRDNGQTEAPLRAPIEADHEGDAPYIGGPDQQFERQAQTTTTQSSPIRSPSPITSGFIAPSA